MCDNQKLRNSSTTASVPGRTRSITAKLRRTILICEDDEGIRDFLRDALQEERYAVEVARNGREALERLQHGDVRYLLLLDLMMPEISGYEVLERMNADPRLCGEHLVIVVSAIGLTRPLSPGIIEKRLVREVLKKPFELDELLALVERLA